MVIRRKGKVRGASPGCLPLVEATRRRCPPASEPGNEPLVWLKSRPRRLTSATSVWVTVSNAQMLWSLLTIRCPLASVGARDRVAGGGGGHVCFLLSPATLATRRPIFSRDRMRAAGGVSLFIRTVILVFCRFTARLSLLR